MIKSGLKREAVKKTKMVMDKTRDDRYYKGPGGAGAGITNKDSGYSKLKKYGAAGSFKHDNRNKPQTKGKSKMTGKTDYVTNRLKKISEGMFKARKNIGYDKDLGNNSMSAQSNA